MVIDFLGTLFVTFCIGAATALVLGACVVLMAGDAHGAPQPRPAPATTADLVLAHYTAARHAGLALAERAVSPAKPGKQKPQAPATN
jgi:hypothetical protein